MIFVYARKIQQKKDARYYDQIFVSRIKYY